MSLKQWITGLMALDQNFTLCTLYNNWNLLYGLFTLNRHWERFQLLLFATIIYNFHITLFSTCWSFNIKSGIKLFHILRHSRNYGQLPTSTTSSMKILKHHSFFKCGSKKLLNTFNSSFERNTPKCMQSVKLTTSSEAVCDYTWVTPTSLREVPYVRQDIQHYRCNA